MKWVESWYISYALLGLSAGGLIPILLPLLIGPANGAAGIGLVMAAFSLGGLSAPLWGGLADRFRMHRQLLVAGLLGIGLGAGLVPGVLSLSLRALLALLAGIGLASASTVANLFIVEVHPEAEWDNRIGWLQTFYGGGQVAGLVLAGVFGENRPGSGLWLAGGIGVLAIVPAMTGTRRISGLLLPRRPVLSRPAHHPEWPPGSPQHLYHHATREGLRAFFAPFRASFARFLVAWFFSFSGSAAFFSFYPVVMRQAYGVLPGLSSTGYALAAGLGLLLYAPAGTWSRRKGPRVVLKEALLLRIAAFSALALLATVSFAARGWLALLFFLLVVLAWSLLSVSGTALVADLSPQNEGEGMGVFNALTALSGVVGAVLGGWAADRWGYVAIPVLGIIGVTAGFLVLVGRRFSAVPEIGEHQEVRP